MFLLKIGELTMKRAILTIVLIILIFQMGGCVVISCEEHMHQKQPHVKCVQTGVMVSEVHMIGF
ncbi:MAG: hypothetical protein A2168_06640 [Planctomycetes bacterium RBG_13_50_24]|nr:MAG: hypothetical protein A2168_06640 [Planctomycetes bacterium RBG_13_50_24]